MLQLDFQSLLRGEYGEWLFKGFIFSLQLTGLTLLLALPLATLVALLRLAPSRIANAISFAFVEGQRSVPLLVHMLFWYFGAPEALPEGIKGWLYTGNVEAVSAVIALTLYTAAYMAEDIRSGLRAVPAAQFDAARALGFSFLASMRLIILPQALRITVPPLISQTLNLWKNTSIATVIGVAETAAYLGISLLITGLAALFQRRFPVRVGS